MPLFHSRNKSSSSSSANALNNAPQPPPPQQQQQQQQPPFSASSGLFHAVHALGSIGAPAGNLRSLNTAELLDANTTSFQTTTSASANPRASMIPNSTNPAPLSNPHPAAAHSSAAALPAVPSLPSNTPQYSSPVSRGASSHPYTQQSDELHLGANTGPPRINLQQSGPAEPQSQSNQLPGALQSGGSRATPSSSAAAAQSSISGSQSAMADPYASPRSAGHNHSYSRSSPNTGAYEGQPFGPFSPGGSHDAGQYTSSSSSKYTPQGQQRNVSSTPLGLADIRPRADSGVNDSMPGANPYSYDGATAQPTNSNYLAPWAIYAFDWCKWPAQGHDAGKVAVGSYLEDGHNFIQILESQITPASPSSYTPTAPKYGLEFHKVAEATHSYPVTRLLWEPPSSQKQSTDLLATSGDHLRLWSLPSDTPMSSSSNSISRSANQGRDLPPTKLTPLALLSNSKTPEHTAPLTSLDWNTVSPSLIITSSIDTTCTIWDIPTLTAKTQLIAHDKEVFDVRFCANSVDVFVSCGADGSVRMFDLRSLEHSTIIYEPTSKDDKDPNSATGRISPTLAQQTMSYAPPLLRLAASPHDQHLLATFSQDSNVIRILDVRQPGQALLELHGHGAAINCIEWSPNRRGTLASGGDDSMVLIWDLINQSVGAPGGNGVTAADNVRGPASSWRCDYEVGNISWAPHSGLSQDGGDWLGVSGGRGIWGVKL